MRTPFLGIILACGGAMTITVLAREPISTSPPSEEPRIDAGKEVDQRPRAAGVQLETGGNAIYKNVQGGTLQAVVDRRGAITGYLLVEAAGKVTKLKEHSDVPVTLGLGEMALVHKCYVITQECLDNPLPRSGNPEDCAIEIKCPDRGSFSNQLSR